MEHIKEYKCCIFLVPQGTDPDHKLDSELNREDIEREFNTACGCTLWDPHLLRELSNGKEKGIKG